MMEIVLLQVLGLEIPLHREHLGHAVRDGRTRGEHHTAPAVERLDMPHLQIHVEGPFAGGLRQACDARHLRDVKQVFEVMRLVHEDSIHAKFLERECVVLFVLGSEGLQLGFQPLLRLFDLLHETAIRGIRVLPLDHLQLVKLLLEEPLLGFARQRDALES